MTTVRSGSNATNRASHGAGSHSVTATRTLKPWSRRSARRRAARAPAARRRCDRPPAGAPSLPPRGLVARMNQRQRRADRNLRAETREPGQADGGVDRRRRRAPAAAELDDREADRARVDRAHEARASRRAGRTIGAAGRACARAAEDRAGRRAPRPCARTAPPPRRCRARARAAARPAATSGARRASSEQLGGERERHFVQPRSRCAPVR